MSLASSLDSLAVRLQDEKHGESEGRGDQRPRGQIGRARDQDRDHRQDEVESEAEFQLEELSSDRNGTNGTGMDSNSSEHQLNRRNYSSPTAVSGTGTEPARAETSTPSSVQIGSEEIEINKEGGAEAWLMVFACSLSFFITLGLVYSFGVLQSELIQRGVANASTLGWVSSTTVISLPVFAIPCNAFCIKFGNRIVSYGEASKRALSTDWIDRPGNWYWYYDTPILLQTGLIGAILTGTGYLWTSFVMKPSKVPLLFLAQAIFGLGYAFTFWATNSLAASYFVKKRALAIGIVYSGSGIGGAVFSIGLSHLIKRVGLEMAVRIYSFIAFAVLIPASLILKPKSRAQSGKFTLSYFKDTKFNLLMIGTGLTTFSIFVPPFFLPTYTVSAGYSATTGAWLVAGNNLSSALGRVLFGLLADSRVGPVTTLLLAIFLMGSSILAIWQVSSNIAALVIFILINGSAAGALLSLQPPVNAFLFGLKDMATTMSFLFMSRAFGSALGGPIAGYLLDAFGGANAGTQAYRPALLLFGFLSLASGGFILGVRWIVGGWDLKKRV